MSVRKVLHHWLWWCAVLQQRISRCGPRTGTERSQVTYTQTAVGLLFVQPAGPRQQSEVKFIFVNCRFDLRRIKHVMGNDHFGFVSKLASVLSVSAITRWGGRGQGALGLYQLLALNHNRFYFVFCPSWTLLVKKIWWGVRCPLRWLLDWKCTISGTRYPESQPGLSQERRRV